MGGFAIRFPRPFPRIDWIIAGGESGPHARPSHSDWFRSLRDQCQDAGVPFFFKHWGEWRPICEGEGDWHEPLYRSLRLAKEGEDQAALDEAYGRACIVPTICLRLDGQHVGITEPMAFQQGTGAMLGFRVGKRAAGATLDGREWREVPV
jgi:protein gp37